MLRLSTQLILIICTGPTLSYVHKFSLYTNQEDDSFTCIMPKSFIFCPNCSRVIACFVVRSTIKPNSLTHVIPSPQPTRATVLSGCLPILASQKPAENGSSPITVFHLPLLCDFSILFTKIYYDCYHNDSSRSKFG